MQKTVPIEEFEALKAEKDREITQLKSQLYWLKKFIFGSKSEKKVLPQRDCETIDLFDEHPGEKAAQSEVQSSEKMTSV